jgi:energy-coupling factor transporter ATP-binding protein EcfA2
MITQPLNTLQVNTLQAVGQLETVTRDLADLQGRLEQLDLWQPAHGLAKQAQEARGMIAAMQARIDQRLVVTLIGPSGAGKSTLLNALAGVDNLSAMGLQRPTTRQLVVLASDPEAGRQLLGPFDADQVQVHSSPSAEMLSHVILVDTPDTDTTQRDSHLELLRTVVERSDVLICVFDAQNPKRRDHADFMAPLVHRFSGASLVAVLNKCDRLDVAELHESIVPDFEAYLQQAWPMQPKALFLISARRHLQKPQWDGQAVPRHDLDQFEDLRELIFLTFNQAGFGSDRRVANARQLLSFMQEQTRVEAGRDRPALAAAREKIGQAEQAALHQALEQLRGDDPRQILGVNVRLYQALSQRWIGPVGWLVAIWARLTIFGSGLAALVRFGNPLSQIWGVVSSWRRFKESRAALAALTDHSGPDKALQAFGRQWLIHWPDIGELLVKGRFDASVRRLDPADRDQVGRQLDQLWAEALDTEIQHSAARLSHPLLQLIFNLPSLALFAYVGWLTMVGFFTGSYLSTDFFLHALLTIVIVLLLSFFILQAGVRVVTGRDRVQRRAFLSVEKTVADRPPVAGRRVADQAARVVDLADDR